MVASGTYNIKSSASQKVARFSTNLAGTPVEFVFASGADNENWVIKSNPDGTFTIRNQAWADNAYVGVDSISSGQQVKATSGATQWKQSGNQIVASGYAWQLSGDGSVILKPTDSVDPNQSFTLPQAQ